MRMPEQYRSEHPLGWKHLEGDPFGWFMVPSPFKQQFMAVQADAQTEWEHLSVSLKNRCPIWEEMCFLKSLFWEPEDCVVQYHPPASQYVNFAKNCLHLWRYRGVLPSPPTWMVGPK